MRITQEGMVASSLTRLTKRLDRFSDAQEQLATGKRFLRPSEDPAAANRSLLLRAEQRAGEQQTRNAADAQSWLGLADTQLQSATSRVQRVRDLLVRGANNAEQSERDAIAIEVAAIRDELVAIANSTKGGTPLFSGFSSNAPVAEVAGVWTYQGDGGQITRRVGDAETVTVNVTAEDVFGFAAGADIFTALDDAEAALRSGDEAGIRAGIGDVDAGLTRIHDGLALVGSAANRVDSALARVRDGLLDVKGEIAATEDVDIAEAVMNLQTQEVAFQATLAAMGRVLQPSLIDFLR